jgi:hypothetical protein
VPTATTRYPYRFDVVAATPTHHTEKSIFGRTCYSLPSYIWGVRSYKLAQAGQTITTGQTRSLGSNLARGYTRVGLIEVTHRTFPCRETCRCPDAEVTTPPPKRGGQSRRVHPCTRARRGNRPRGMSAWPPNRARQSRTTTPATRTHGGARVRIP